MTYPLSRELENVVREARDLALGTKRRLSSAHLLLALFTSPNQAQQYLREHAIDEDTLLQKLDKLVDDPPELLDLILERATRMAEGSELPAVTSLHLLAALIAFKDGSAYQLMGQSGVDIGELRIRAMSFLLNDEVPIRYRVQGNGTPRIRIEPKRQSVPEPTSTIQFHPGLQAQARRRDHRRRGTETTTHTEPTVSRPRAGESEPERAKGSQPSATPPKSGSIAGQANLAARLFSGRPRPAATQPRPAKPRRPAPTRPAAAARPKARVSPSVPRSKGSTQGSAADRWRLDKKAFPTLRRFGRNLTIEAALGRIDPVIGRDEEIAQLVDILNKRRSNNPVLVGDPGVGKTAVVEGLARRLVAESPPPGLEGRIIIELEAGRVFGGTGLRGSLAERLVALKDEVLAAEGRVVVFLDEIHRWLGSGDGSADGVEELKPALARGAFPCIGATTHEEFKKSAEADPAFGRRFQIVRVEEPGVDETAEILRGVRDDYAAHHQLGYSDRAVLAAARLAHRYLPDRRNPDKALAVLDLAGSKARRLEREEVGEDVVAEVVAEMSGVPASKLLMSERERFLRMEDHLMQSIVGHERNLARIAHVLRRNYAGFVSGRPIGSFLFLGPTGVGKTETAKVLADFLFHSREAITTLDMSEYSETHAVARLVGAPPGYVGHDSGGLLTESVRRRAYQIILFDEIEKASPAVLNLLLQLLDEGRLTDSRGRVVDFAHTVVVLTSNLGAEQAFSSAGSVGFGRAGAAEPQVVSDRILEAARGHLEPELWNRLDEALAFEPLKRDQVERIAHLQLQASGRRLLDEKGIAYSASPAVVDFLIDHGGYDAELGARPMRRALERYVEGPIADLILSGAVERAGEISVDVDGDELVFDVR